MKKILLIILIPFIIWAQPVKVEKISGDVKVLAGSSEKWRTLNAGDEINKKSLIATGENSSVILSGRDFKFTLKEQSAVNSLSLKKLTLDELMLALTMEQIIDAPKKKESINGRSTAVYGAKQSSKILFIESDDLGIKRLNGAVQLADNGFKETAVIYAKETYRKYPDTKHFSSFRIYFADILFDKSLYEEAYAEFTEINKLDLNDEEKESVNEKINKIKEKLLAK